MKSPHCNEVLTANFTAAHWKHRFFISLSSNLHSAWYSAYRGMHFIGRWRWNQRL